MLIMGKRLILSEFALTAVSPNSQVQGERVRSVGKEQKDGKHSRADNSLDFYVQSAVIHLRWI